MENAILQVSISKNLYFVTAATTIIKNTEDLPLNVILKIQ